MSQKLRKIMIENVITARPNDTVRKAVELMNLHGISSLIVVDSERPIGMVTERDMLNRILNKKKVIATAKVKDIMSKPVITASINMRAGDAARVMIKESIKKLPIVKKGKLVGLVSLTDLLRSDGVVEFLNTRSLDGTSVHMKKALSFYLDQGCQKKKRCPLITEQGFHVGCLENTCMWWTGEECAVTHLSGQRHLTQMPELSIRRQS